MADLPINNNTLPGLRTENDALRLELKRSQSLVGRMRRQRNLVWPLLKNAKYREKIAYCLGDYLRSGAKARATAELATFSQKNALDLELLSRYRDDKFVHDQCVDVPGVDGEEEAAIALDFAVDDFEVEEQNYVDSIQLTPPTTQAPIDLDSPEDEDNDEEVVDDDAQNFGEKSASVSLNLLQILLMTLAPTLKTTSMALICACILSSHEEKFQWPKGWIAALYTRAQTQSNLLLGVLSSVLPGTPLPHVINYKITTTAKSLLRASMLGLLRIPKNLNAATFVNNVGEYLKFSAEGGKEYKYLVPIVTNHMVVSFVDGKTIQDRKEYSPAFWDPRSTKNKKEKQARDGYYLISDKPMVSKEELETLVKENDLLTQEKATEWQGKLFSPVIELDAEAVGSLRDMERSFDLMYGGTDHVAVKVTAQLVVGAGGGGGGGQVLAVKKKRLQYVCISCSTKYDFTTRLGLAQLQCAGCKKDTRWMKYSEWLNLRQRETTGLGSDEDHYHGAKSGFNVDFSKIDKHDFARGLSIDEGDSSELRVTIFGKDLSKPPKTMLACERLGIYDAGTAVRRHAKHHFEYEMFPPIPANPALELSQRLLLDVCGSTMGLEGFGDFDRSKAGAMSAEDNPPDRYSGVVGLDRGIDLHKIIASDPKYDAFLPIAEAAHSQWSLQTMVLVMFLGWGGMIFAPAFGFTEPGSILYLESGKNHRKTMTFLLRVCWVGLARGAERRRRELKAEGKLPENCDTLYKWLDYLILGKCKHLSHMAFIVRKIFPALNATIKGMRVNNMTLAFAGQLFLNPFNFVMWRIQYGIGILEDMRRLDIMPPYLRLFLADNFSFGQTPGIKLEEENNRLESAKGEGDSEVDWASGSISSIIKQALLKTLPEQFPDMPNLNQKDDLYKRNSRLVYTMDQFECEVLQVKHKTWYSNAELGYPDEQIRTFDGKKKLDVNMGADSLHLMGIDRIETFLKECGNGMNPERGVATFPPRVYFSQELREAATKRRQLKAKAQKVAKDAAREAARLLAEGAPRGDGVISEKQGESGGVKGGGGGDEESKGGGAERREGRGEDEEYVDDDGLDADADIDDAYVLQALDDDDDEDQWQDFEAEEVETDEDDD